MSDQQEINEDYDPSWLTGKTLERELEIQDALFEFTNLFRYEATNNDRELAIIGGAFVDLLLAHIMRNFLVDDEKEVEKLLQVEQPLGTFGTRVTALYCMGFIPKTVRDDLRLLGRIRNRFAHDLYASFDNEQIRSWCSSLKWHRIVYIQPPADASARDLFYVGVNQLIAYLSGMASLARTEKRRVRVDFDEKTRQ